MAENSNNDGGKAIQSNISCLSNELLLEILCRLGSSKHATQCKCICKRWFSLVNSTISRDSYFIRRWRKIHKEEEEGQPIALLTQYTLVEEEEDDFSNYSLSSNKEEDDYCPATHNSSAADWIDMDDLYDLFDYSLWTNNSCYDHYDYYDDYDYFDDYSLSLNNSLGDYREKEDECSIRENYHAISYPSLLNNALPTFNPLYFLPCNMSSDNNVADIDRVTPICILATSKDLVLCCPNLKDHSVYYLCNPFTRQWISLPPPTLPPGYDFHLVRVVLAASDDGSDLKFKVVRFLDPIGNGRDVKDMVKVETFSSDDWMWRARYISVPEYWGSRALVSYNEMLVWWSEYRDLKGITLFSDDNIAFVDTDANYTFLSFPVDYNGSSSHIGVCKGCLRIGQVDEINYDDDYPPKLNIWELNKHIQDWELVHELDFREFNLPELRLDEYFEGSSIVAFHPRDGDILYLSFVTNANSMTCLCNVRERTVEKIREGPKRDWSDIEVFPIEMSSWPTPIPLLSLSPGLQYQND